MDYNGDILDIERNNLLVNQITKNGRKFCYKLFLFKMRSKSDKLRHYEISNSVTSENFIKAYLTKESNFILLSNNRFYMYDNETKKKRCLMNLNDSEPIDFIYFKEHIIFIQKNKFSLFQSKANGKCNVMLNLKDTPLKVNFCSYKNILYLSTCRRLYFLKLIYLKDKTLKVKNTNMSLPFKSKKEKYLYHSYKNKYYKLNKEYKEVIHVCSYSDKDITVYKFVKGKYKNKKKCLVKLSVNKLNNEIIKGGFFFKINVFDKEKKINENIGNENNDKKENTSHECHIINSITEENILNREKLKNGNDNVLLSSTNLFSDDKRKETERENNSNISLNSLNMCEHSENRENNIPFDLNVCKENENSNMKEQGNICNLKIKENIIKLYLLIYGESGKIQIYFIDYLNQESFKFGFANIKKNPVLYMQLPFKTYFIYNVSDIFSERVAKQKSIIQKKKRLSSNYNKYLEHIMNKEIYINSNFFFDAVAMNDNTAKIYTIQINHDFLYTFQNNTESIELNVIDSNNKIIAVKNMSDNEKKKNLIDKVINESKFSCYSDSDSYIDSEITWEDSDNSDKKSSYNESDSLMESDSTNDEDKEKLNSVNNFANNMNMENKQNLLEIHLNGNITNESPDVEIKKIKEIKSSAESKKSVNSSVNKDNIEFCSQEYCSDDDIYSCKNKIIDESYALDIKNCAISIDEKKKKINHNENMENHAILGNNDQDIYNGNSLFLNNHNSKCLENENINLLNGNTDNSNFYLNEENLENSSEFEINKNILKNQNMLYSTNSKNSSDDLCISSSSLLNKEDLSLENSYANENKLVKSKDEELYNEEENIYDKNLKDENEKEEILLELKKVEEIYSYNKSHEFNLNKKEESNINKREETIINNENSSTNKKKTIIINDEIEHKETENEIKVELKQVKQKRIEKKRPEKRVKDVEDKKYKNEEIELDIKEKKNETKENIKIEDEKKNIENKVIIETIEENFDNIENKNKNIKKKNMRTYINETETESDKEGKNIKENNMKKSKKIKEVEISIQDEGGINKENAITDEQKGITINEEMNKQDVLINEKEKFNKNMKLKEKNIDKEKEMYNEDIKKENESTDKEKKIDENEKMNNQNVYINEEKEIYENIKSEKENTCEGEKINKNEEINKECNSSNEEKGNDEKKEKIKKKKKRNKKKEEEVVKEDIEENILEKSKKRKTDDEFSYDRRDFDNNSSDLKNNYNHDMNNKLDKDLVNSNDKFLVISSMIKLNISLKRYCNVIDLINTKDEKLIKNTIINLGKKHSIKLLEFLLSSLTKSKFFINTFYIWIKTICKVHKSVLKEKTNRRLVTKISGIATNILKNEYMVKHVVEKINYTIDNIIKNQVFDNVENLNYKDGTIIK
ncbi:conserved Plasmodium protein, unknown function [Plasmodium gallinaceum]|uniref:Uncharacterized protein n=1 Tax=Plasmodium gallinaceum TaxID=5849 RepID=A0A1J1GVC9_PLAGA|nr:conserved Plasmodium protein, unknown function [Plasmodium gallinaceum]CRG96418.1 conserved Plasmodium protein, unknown function [Plasmodium gallinaceum]